MSKLTEYVGLSFMPRWPPTRDATIQRLQDVISSCFDSPEQRPHFKVLKEQINTVYQGSFKGTVKKKNTAEVTVRPVVNRRLSYLKSTENLSS